MSEKVIFLSSQKKLTKKRTDYNEANDFFVSFSII